MSSASRKKAFCPIPSFIKTAGDGPSTKSAGVNLFLSGFVILFFELACIRWFPSFVVFLQFFTNLVLIACFFGMSIGCMCSSSKTDWLSKFPYLVLTALLCALSLFFSYQADLGFEISTTGQRVPDVIFFGLEYIPKDIASYSIPLELVAGFFFILISLIFVGPGQFLGRCFEQYPNRVGAYTLNILGSIAGVVSFGLLSLFEIPSPIWFGLSFCIIGFFLKQTDQLTSRKIIYLTASVIVVTITAVSFKEEVEIYSSPYYTVRHNIQKRSIEVNTLAHQGMASWRQSGSIYSFIHLLNRDIHRPPFKDVLIIGAGAGNDVSHSLLHQSESIDAIEIDPVIQRIGLNYHPDNPYDDARVVVHITDGRNYLRNTKKKYDLIVYALVDSLILHSSYSSLRLESFLFTQEAFSDVKDALKPNGVFVTYNLFRYGWLVERLSFMLERVFGEPPLTFSFPYVDKLEADTLLSSVTLFISGSTKTFSEAFASKEQFWLNRQVSKSLEHNGFSVSPPSQEFGWLPVAPLDMAKSTDTQREVSDDWPFLYMKSPSVPWRPYMTGILTILGAALVVMLLFFQSNKFKLSGRMFFLGAGFMLLETRAVVNLALVFGSTWLVNSLVFLTILLMILLSNFFVLKFPIRSLVPYYIGLFLTLFLNFITPLSLFLSGGLMWKYAAPCILSMLPVFFAGVIFAVTFRNSTNPDRDYGSNIAGAVVGGLAEYLSMLLGFRYLLVVAFIFYALSSMVKRKSIC